MTEKLDIQILLDGQWHDAARLDIEQVERGRLGAIALGYEDAYALEWQGRDDHHACSLVLPVELMLRHHAPRWFGFLDDIMPAGAARRYWVAQLGLGDRPPAQQDFELLRHGAIAPVGNLRIRQALEQLPAQRAATAAVRFNVMDVVERHSDFLEYAQQMGAISGGATGAGGEAPKLLLRCSARDEVWIDAWQDSPQCGDDYYLVKFPRGGSTARDCDILRAEYLYYQELHALGCDTISTAGMRLIEGEHYPSLWLPRFDVRWEHGQWQRAGLESVYAILHEAPGAMLRHGDVLRRLIRIMQQQYRVTLQAGSWDQEAFVSEWLRRDLLNIVFGNSDNHGRNTAFLKGPDGIRLAPIYDFAPMKADLEGVIRSLQWGAPLERGGDYDWVGIIRSLADLAPPELLMRSLRELASQLVGLRDRLASRGMPPSLLQLPTLGLGTVDTRLQRWGLL